MHTNMTAEADEDIPKFMGVTPQTFAKQAVRSIGLVSETAGCLNHQLQYAVFCKLIPEFVLDMLLAYQAKVIEKRMVEIRKKK